VKQGLHNLLLLLFLCALAPVAWCETTQTLQAAVPSTATTAVRTISLYDAFALPLRLSDILTTLTRQREEVTTPPAAIITPEMIKADFDHALSLIQRGREREAKAALKSFVAKYPDSPYVPQARYQIGLLETDVPAAISEMETLVKEHPTSSWTSLALTKIGELQFLLGNYNEAIGAYKRYLDENPEGQFADIAELQIAYALIKLKDFSSAISLLNELRQRYPRYRFNPEIPDALAECYIQTNQTNKAIEQLQRTVRDFPNYPFISKIYLSLALCLEDSGEVAQATSIYKEIKDRFSRSSEARLAELRLEDIVTTTVARRH
jgi:TolA-binding protein